MKFLIKLPKKGKLNIFNYSLILINLKYCYLYKLNLKNIILTYLV